VQIAPAPQGTPLADCPSASPIREPRGTILLGFCFVWLKFFAEYSMLLWLIDCIRASADDPLLASPVVRACCAGLLSLSTVMTLGTRTIAWLAERFREPNKSDSAQLAALHAHKAATPTMGGLLMLTALGITAFLFGDLSNRLLQIAVFLCGGFAAIGAYDDWVKLSTSRPGMTAKWKLFAELVVSILCAVVLERAIKLDFSVVSLPGVAGGVDVGAWSIPLAALVIVGTANAVNLTDGLDGLATGCLASAFAAMSVLCVASDSGWNEYFRLPENGWGTELAVMSAAACGATLGFLRFNRHPAKVFMGDTGALPLGALLGLVSVAGQLQWVLVLIGIVFVAETLSVILQVASFKLTGKRIFRCAPLHHHFQFLGWSERRTVTRFWIASALAATATVAGICLTAVASKPSKFQWTASARANQDPKVIER
jgi:phospho-N-acetylmuramoyl-pentapeptide-transferase